ncbi:MAG: hypothetical protein LQ350_003157 [Teloschistes chrysophthalmus]|nr:MAG: hypothetical protein LQ350_003157 [Niorma chrysophthalma]
MAASTPSTMRAWQYSSSSGGLEKNLKINASAPLPTPKPDQHLVKVIAAALNPVDYKVAEIPGMITLVISKPATPCIDFAGSIVKPAAGSSLKPGQLVFGAAGTTPLAGGALREYAIAGTKAVTPLPDNVNVIDAASVAIGGLTAYQSIVPHVKEGDKIFINGGSGGVGAFGIQIAKAVGCHVTTTCSTPNVELCKSLGADRVVDYKKENVVDALAASGYKFDHAVDNVGTQKDVMWRSHEYLKPEAILVAVGGEPSMATVTNTLKMKLQPRFLGGLKRKVVGLFADPRAEELQRIGEWMSEGKIKALIDSKFSFEEAPKAFEKLKTGRAKGKIVVDVAFGEFGKGSS